MNSITLFFPKQKLTMVLCELPRAKALRLPASTTDSIPLMGYGGLISTGVTSLRPVGTHRASYQQTM